MTKVVNFLLLAVIFFPFPDYALLGYSVQKLPYIPK